MNKRAHALSVIRYEYATHGRETRESKHAYMENRISFDARFKEGSEGLKIFNNRGDK